MKSDGPENRFAAAFVKVFFATNRKIKGSSLPVQFDVERRKEGAYYGTVYVDVPVRRSVGSLTGVKVLKTALHEKEHYFSLIRNEASAAKATQAFIFIHGFNVSFDDAARRTAQIKVDTHFDGPALFFSWPSQASSGAYYTDEAMVKLTLPLLKSFLLDAASQLKVDRIHVIAHSMGTYALSEAVRELGLAEQLKTPLFDQVILAAADIDTEYFKERILPHFKASGRRLTMYASPNDFALTGSAIPSGRVRIGRDVDTVVSLMELEGIDASSADCVAWWRPWEGWNHAYYGDVPAVLKDIQLVLAGKSREDRVENKSLSRKPDRFVVSGDAP